MKFAAERVSRLSSGIREIIRERYNSDKAIADFDFAQWTDDIAAELDVPVNLIRDDIAKIDREVRAHLRVKYATRAQAVADALGATEAAALAVLRDGLVACKYKPVLDINGVPLKGEDGEPLFVSVPDHQTRIRAAQTILNVHGGYAPKKVEHTGEVTHTHRSESELLQELQQVIQTLNAGGVTIDVPVQLVEAPKQT